MAAHCSTAPLRTAHYCSPLTARRSLLTGGGGELGPRAASLGVRDGTGPTLALAVGASLRAFGDDPWPSWPVIARSSPQQPAAARSSPRAAQPPLQRPSLAEAQAVYSGLTSGPEAGGRPPLAAWLPWRGCAMACAPTHCSLLAGRHPMLPGIYICIYVYTHIYIPGARRVARAALHALPLPHRPQPRPGAPPAHQPAHAHGAAPARLGPPRRAAREVSAAAEPRGGTAAGSGIDRPATTEDC